MLIVKNVKLTHLPYYISFNLEKGQCLGISGESGVGKTQLLRLISDLDSGIGEMFYNNRNINTYHPTTWRKLIGYLPAENQWWYEITKDHFKYLSSPLFEKLNLNPEILKQPVHQLSSGEKQRLALIRLFDCNSPRFLLLDEPTAALDIKNTYLYEHLIHELQVQRNIGVLWISHDEAQIKRVCHKRLYMNQSEIKEEIFK